MNHILRSLYRNKQNPNHYVVCLFFVQKIECPKSWTLDKYQASALAFFRLYSCSATTIATRPRPIESVTRPG